MIQGGRDARYVPTGHLVYVLGGTLLAVPFEADSLEVTGGPVPMAEGVMTAGEFAGTAQFAVSDAGSLVYVSGRRLLANRTLVGVNRQGREEALTAEPRAYNYPRISPDGGRVALDVRDQESKRNIWIWDFSRETLTRLTFDAGFDVYPTWTPDGQRVVFGANREGPAKLFWKAADGTGNVELLTESDNPQFPQTVSPDGKRVVFREDHPERGADLGVHSMDADGASAPLLTTEFSELNAEISPDGRFLAYQSNASGQNEIYVRPFPNVEDGQWPISSGGGTRPLWARDGQELFYLSSAGQLMGVHVQTEPSFTPGNAELVFEGDYFAPAEGGTPGRTYDISPDGKRFLMIKESAGGDSTEFVVIINWFEELQRLVPTVN